MSTEQRVARVLSKMAPGTMGGQSRVATAVLPSKRRLPVLEERHPCTPIEFVAAGTARLDTFVDTPAGLLAGDMIIVGVASRTSGGGTSDIDVPDFTLIAKVVLTSVHSVGLFYRVANPATDPATWPVSTPSGANRQQAWAYRNVDNDDPVADFSVNDGVDLSGPPETVTWLPVSVVHPGSMLVGVCSTVAIGGPGPSAYPVPTGTTLRWPALSAGGGQAQGMGWDLPIGVGTTGPYDTSINSTDEWSTVLAVLQPDC